MAELMLRRTLLKDLRLRLVKSIMLLSITHNPWCQQSELSKEEMKQSVPSLTAKIVNNRPLIVCFVGKGIWVIVEAVFKKQVRSVRPDPTYNDKRVDDIDQLHAGEIPLISTSVRGMASPNRRVTKRPRASKTFDWGLQPYKFVYPDPHGQPSSLLLQ